jgi:hypothetical protein
MIVSIHQPNYLPWIKFFHKIIFSDTYIVFDDVQLPRGKSFVLRNKIKTENKSGWLTVPVKNKSSMLSINEIQLNNNINWKESHWNKICQNYSKTKFFDTFQKDFGNVFLENYEYLLESNISIIKLILKILDVKTKIKFSSDLKIKSHGTNKILDIIESVNGDEYYSGTGGGTNRYVIGKEEIFKKHNIKIKFQNFSHPKYPQLFGNFIEGLSIIDMIFNLGGKRTYNILKSIR